MHQRTLSFVLPVFDEEGVCPELCRRLSRVLDGIGYDYELLFVDDGSQDQTLALIKEEALRNPRIKFVSFSRNFGHQVSVSAGLDYARGDAVVVMDGDLQDPPEVVPGLVRKWQEGWDVVYAVRKKRKENFVLRSCYHLFYRFLGRISDVPMPPDAGDFCLMDRRVVQVLKAMPERNRYVRGIRAWAGFKQCGVEYERDKRFAGKSKYSFAKLMRLGLDGITAFSQFPLRLCGYLGYAMAFFSLMGLCYTLISKIWIHSTPRGWTSITLAIFFIGGVQLIMLSLVGSYVGRIYTEVQRRPLYVVREMGNLPQEISHDTAASNLP